MSTAADLRDTTRALVRRPAFTIAAVLTLALGLAGVIGIVAVADVLLLSPLPYPSPDRLYVLSATVPGPNGRPAPFVLSTVEFVRSRERTPSLEQVEAMTPTEMSMIAGDETVTIRVGRSSAGYLHLFGLDPVVGRAFSEAEDRERAPVVILDGGLWARQFGSDPQIIGRTITIDGVAAEVIGVTPAGYRPQLRQMDAWMPLGAAVDPARLGNRNLAAAARLRAGVPVERAREELRSVQEEIAREFPQAQAQATLVFTEMHEALYGSYRPMLMLLLAGVGFLLLIACTNVANLALARVAERGGEIAVRLSLGASRARILRMQLLESVALSVVGTALGAGLAWFGLRLLLLIDPAVLPADVQLRVSPRLVLTVGGLLASAALMAGFLPAWRAAGLSAGAALAQSSRRQSGSAGERRLREWLLGLQVAFALLLLSLAAVVVASFERLQRSHPGFDYEQVLTMQLAPPARYPTAAARAQVVGRMLQRVQEIPGVVAAGSTQTTWQVGASMQSRVEIEGLPVRADESLFVHIRHITPGYFPALRVTVAEGRAIDDRDAFGATPVAMVSASFAQRFWPGQSALGRRVRRGSPNAPWLQVVGVVPEAMDSGLGSSNGATIYVPYMQQNTATARVTLVVRAQEDPAALAPLIRKAIRDVDPQQPVDAVRTLESALVESTAQPRFRATALGIFGFIGLVVACVGVYGVAAYAAARRQREVGVRMALGAEASDVVRLLIRQSMIPVLAGVVLGLVVGTVTARSLGTVLLPGETVRAGTLLTAAAALILCAVVATWIPARRASRLAPTIALQRD